MSQQKVDYKKEQKKNRKETVKKNKVKARIWGCVGAVIGVVVIAYLVYSGVQQYDRYRVANPKTTEVSLAAIEDYVGSIDADETSDDAE